LLASKLLVDQLRHEELVESAGKRCRHPSRRLRLVISSSLGPKEFDEPLVTRS
jgi:hypothetical protein